ncbi:hypothetical protein HPB51_001760 [Rhipicephalus microplus]|uniref:Uncharacterized protein n=1 Tax=Rhipicephalus microplus TaxID=6941 RepID=A0A9J6ERA6_RHIMP|nr:hypothetical protein HPB51_001760 [Rhipicephalus microplus]
MELAEWRSVQSDLQMSHMPWFWGVPEEGRIGVTVTPRFGHEYAGPSTSSRSSFSVPELRDPRPRLYVATSLTELRHRMLDDVDSVTSSALNRATGVSVENLKDTFHNTLYPFTWDLPKHDKVVVHIPEGANNIQMGQIILQALVEGCQENVTKKRCDCRSNTNSSFLDVGALLVADCSGL